MLNSIGLKQESHERSQTDEKWVESATGNAFSAQQIPPYPSVKEGDASKLSELMVGFCTYLATSLPDFEKEHGKLQNCLDFLLMMPIDTAALFISQIDGFDRLSKQFQYMTTLHLAMMDKDRTYKKKFYDPIVAAGEGKLK